MDKQACRHQLSEAAAGIRAYYIFLTSNKKKNNPHYLITAQSINLFATNLTLLVHTIVANNKMDLPANASRLPCFMYKNRVFPSSMGLSRSFVFLTAPDNH